MNLPRLSVISVLSVVKYFSRKTDQEKKPLQLSSIVKETMKLLRASIPTTISIKVEVRSESGLILGDPIQVQQVLMNLCMNAAYAMREKRGVLGVELSDFSVNGDGKVKGLQSGLYMKLVVRDTGTGILPEDMEKIFDPFFTTKPVGKGSGMGLSVVHGIVKKLGGTVAVSSKEGEGSRFTVYLPLYGHGSGARAFVGEGPDASRKNILLVDDEEAVVDALERSLKRMGYKVTASMSSREALDLFRENPEDFDLVITDMTMPGMTGMELGKRIMKIRPGIPVILCTGFSDIIDAQGAKDMGLTGLLMKPAGTGELKAAVQQALED